MDREVIAGTSGNRNGKEAAQLVLVNKRETPL